MLANCAIFCPRSGIVLVQRLRDMNSTKDVEKKQIESNLKLSPNVNARDLFDSFDHRVNWRRVYFAYFRTLPNSKSISAIDCNKLLKWIEKSKSEKILIRNSDEEYRRRHRRLVYENITYILSGGIIILLSPDRDYVEILFSNKQEEAQTLFESIRKFKKKSSALHINLIVSDREGLSLKDLKSKKLALQLAENYNTDLIQLHQHLVIGLKKDNSNGLVLFHGEPGTGKSTYIRFLTGFVKKRIIFLSPRMAGNLDDPGFAKLLTENPNSVVIIEDAEDLLISRDAGKNSGISMLLNLTDGLLGTSLGIQFICTFNTALANIDKALLRKGRLLALYEFGPLSIEKTNVLLSKLGIADFTPTQPMTLADIYNVSKPGFQMEAKRNSIGFNVCAA